MTFFLFLRRRLSLPASLLEPIPNLEYWHYLDRPDLFVSYVSLSLPPLCCVPLTMIGGDMYYRINDHEDPLERMLAVLRFAFSKDIRHIVRSTLRFLMSVHLPPSFFATSSVANPASHITLSLARTSACIGIRPQSHLIPKTAHQSSRPMSIPHQSHISPIPKPVPSMPSKARTDQGASVPSAVYFP